MPYVQGHATISWHVAYCIPEVVFTAQKNEQKFKVYLTMWLAKKRLNENFISKVGREEQFHVACKGQDLNYG